MCLKSKSKLISNFKNTLFMISATQDIRNVVFLGHSGSGKTTFIETMLFESGSIPRRGSIENHNTI